MLFVDEAGPQITPVVCFADYCGDMGAGLVVMTAFWAVLITGALIMQRWRDMFVVAAVAMASLSILEYVRHDLLPPPVELWHQVAFGYVICVLWASVLHAIKRGVLWLAGYRAAPT